MEGSRQARTELCAEHLKVAYDRTIALDIPQLRVTGKIIAIIGHNGSGKSTLLKTLLQLLVPRTGSITAGWAGPGDPIQLVPERHMAFSPENGAVFEDVSVES